MKALVQAEPHLGSLVCCLCGTWRQHSWHLRDVAGNWGNNLSQVRLPSILNIEFAFSRSCGVSISMTAVMEPTAYSTTFPECEARSFLPPSSPLSPSSSFIIEAGKMAGEIKPDKVVDASVPDSDYFLNGRPRPEDAMNAGSMCRTDSKLNSQDAAQPAPMLSFIHHVTLPFSFRSRNIRSDRIHL